MGVVLTGGASRRMGRNKALIDVDGMPMAARVASAMREAGCGTVVALGGDPSELEPLGLPVVAEMSPGEGPLVAVIAALDLAATAGPDVMDVMVLACDLPFVSASDLRRLIDAAVAHPQADVIVARTDRLEPACAIWRPSARRRMQELVERGDRALHVAVGAIGAVEVALDAAALKNMNTPHDLDGYP